MTEILMDARAIGVPLLVALVLGACIGWEREAARKAAGLRTHTLVCLGCCGFVVISLRFAAAQAGLDDGFSMSMDRVIQGVITGMGFIGGGVILQTKTQVTGLTTATSIWVAGAVGLACGLGEYVGAAMIMILALVVLQLLFRVEVAVSDEPKSEDEAG